MKEQVDLTEFDLPKEVDDVTLAFAANIRHLLPPYDAIREIKIDSKWKQLFSNWFFNGLESLELMPKDGIDKNKALRHIEAIMSSYEPKHEHKESAVAYLMSRFFEDAKWTTRKP